MKHPSYLHKDTDFLPPKLENIQILDINENVLKTSLSYELGTKFLSTPSNQPIWPVKGIVFGNNNRLFLNMIVAFISKEGKELVGGHTKHNIIKNVIFLIDTTNPHSYLSSATIGSLLPQCMPNTDELVVSVHELPPFTFYLSPPQSLFRDINVIGAQFLSTFQLKLNIDYQSLQFTLSKANELET